MSDNAYRSELLRTVHTICSPGKGILAADESTGTIGKRFATIGVDNTRETRIAYRDLLFTTPGLNEHISGVITYEETLLDKKENGNRLIQPLLDNSILVGIKVDMGVKPLYGTDGETVTQGMDDLDVRCQTYYKAGARFAKWRAVLKIDTEKQLPSELSIHENAVTLARYASICIHNGLVPIVEPEILMDGTHTISQSRDVAIEVLNKVYLELLRHKVDLDCTLLKPNMVRPGVSCSEESSCEDIARYTVDAFRKSIPVDMPGVVFLSGGMSETEASMALDKINKYGQACPQKTPWRLTFSYGRALQASVLSTWKGDDANKGAAQQVLMVRAKANGKASMGEYETEAETGHSLHEKNYVY